MTLWRFAATGARGRLEPAHARLCERDPPIALSASYFIEDEAADRGRLEALFDSEPALSDILDAAGLSEDDASVRLEPLPEQDWVALSLEGLQPVSAGRFTIHGRHDLAKIPAGQTPVLIDAGQAFGTGHHGTTRGCLIAFGNLVARGASFETILDLGCGAGTLAIAAAKTGSARIVASDIDPVAVAVTLENAALNGVAGRIDAVEADGFGAPGIAGAAPYDLIFANILAEPLRGLAPDIAGALAAGGRVILSGLLTEQEPGVLDAFEAAGLAREDRLALDGWAILVMRKP